MSPQLVELTEDAPHGVSTGNRDARRQSEGSVASDGQLGSSEAGNPDQGYGLEGEMQGGDKDVDDEEDGAVDRSLLEFDAEPKKKRKSKKKPKSKRGRNAPTGFEEYSADGPLTTEENEQDKKLYDPAIPFPHRVISAIHRYEHRRRMTPETRTYFYKYLAYGGLDVGPNMFQGIDPGDAKGMDKDMLVQAMAQTNLSSDFRDISQESSDWVVDWVGVMKGFLSRRAPQLFPLETEGEVFAITNLLANFMNYLILHGVCPEYQADILTARKVCKQASSELWSIHLAGKWLPGDFNNACSTLFEGAHRKKFDSTTTWHNDQEQTGYVGLTDEQARQIMKFGVGCAADEDQYDSFYEKVMTDKLEVIDVKRGIGLEITKITPPDEETKHLYRSKTQNFRPVGNVFAKLWDDPGAPPKDLAPTSTNGAVPDQNGETEEKIYEFYMEEAVQEHLFVGMKMEATIQTLNCGLVFLDEVFRIHATFDTVLPNERYCEFKKGNWRNGCSMGEDGSLQYSPENIEEGDDVDDDDD